MIEIKKPTLKEVEAMRNLLRPEVERGVILERTADEIANAIRSYNVAWEEGEIVGFCALHIHSPSLAEIRSLIVKESHRGRGIATSIIEVSLKEALGLGVKEVLVLTYQRTLFEKLGFVEVSKEAIPDHKIWADCIKCKYFPICEEIALIKRF
ncbi:N-acetyltransferase [Wolinella succinogenes]|uniref:N-acetyltransferase n=1 Tax=Wolinella succinogenes TaxID=844 RepID=UPI0016A36106|nr:N-acetyltransferase [Wolinella succinogenes]